jgi:YLP motif-containing protein 1
MKYEYEAEMEEPYRASLIKAFKKTVDEGYFPIIIVDCVHEKVSQFEEMRCFAISKGVRCYILEVEADDQTCASRNEHERSLEDIERLKKTWEPSPTNMTRLDISGLLQKASIQEVDFIFFWFYDFMS